MLRVIITPNSLREMSLSPVSGNIIYMFAFFFKLKTLIRHLIPHPTTQLYLVDLIYHQTI